MDPITLTAFGLTVASGVLASLISDAFKRKKQKVAITEVESRVISTVSRELANATSESIRYAIATAMHEIRVIVDEHPALRGRAETIEILTPHDLSKNPFTRRKELNLELDSRLMMLQSIVNQRRRELLHSDPAPEVREDSAEEHAPNHKQGAATQPTSPDAHLQALLDRIARRRSESPK